MKQILNDLDNIVSDSFSGMTGAYRKVYEPIGDLTALRYRQRRKEKVSIVIGGGSGHEPMTSGFVGKGLADAAVCGQVFAPPKPHAIYETAKAVDEGQGVLFIHGCYAGDNFNFQAAANWCAADGIQTACIKVWDDCSSAPKERIQDRRGIAGFLFVLKIAGAACDMGLTLPEVVRITQKARDSVNTIAIATSAGTLPGTDRPMFEMSDGAVEYGMGIHGEPGMEQIQMQPAEALVKRMCRDLRQEMDLHRGDEIAVLTNGLGATTLLELYTVYYDLQRIMEEEGIRIYDADVNSYSTCQEMRGFSISFLKMDEELKPFYDAPCASPYYVKGLF